MKENASYELAAVARILLEESLSKQAQRPSFSELRLFDLSNINPNTMLERAQSTFQKGK
jgi:hypothetical protein